MADRYEPQSEHSLGHFSTAAEVTAGLSLTGKHAVVSGGYTGIGLEMTRALHNAGAEVTVLARDPARARRNLRSLMGNRTGARIEIEYFDLLLPAAVDEAAAHILAAGKPIHYLINSAGIINTPLRRDTRGYELQFATNHLGHFQLTARLLPALQRAEGARVVAVSSRGHRYGGVLFDDPHFRHTPYQGMRAYGQSKSANALFALRLDQLGRKDKIRAFSAHPGPVPSSDLFAESRLGIEAPWQIELRRSAAWLMRGLHISEAYNLVRRPRLEDAFKTVSQGAATPLWCALSPDLQESGGIYCEDCAIAARVEADSPAPYGVRPWARDAQLAERLWQLSEELTSIRFF